jgi:hypothetical protein
MIDLTCENGILIYDSQELTYPDMFIVGEFVNINLVNEGNDIWMLLQENYTTINGVIQTSAQMIIDTLNNA